jgi:type IVB pilus formation R64 PilN family outer membrane protein
MLKLSIKPFAKTLLLSTLIAGCASPVTEKSTKAYNDNSLMLQNSVAVQNAEQMNYANRGSATKVSGIWLGSKSIPLKGDPVLPDAFRVLKEFNFPGQLFSLIQAADKIYSISNIQVRIAQDVTREIPGVKAGPILVSLNSTSTTSGILDQITSANGLSWEYRDGVATIQRLITRSFVLKTSPSNNSYSFTAGKSGNTSTGSGFSGGGAGGSISTGFTSASQINSSGEFKPMQSVEAAVKAVLTPIGKVVSSLATGSIVVIDTSEGVDRAARIIDRENEILTRNATFKIEVYSFTANDSDEAGMDWSAIYQNIGKYGAMITSPSTVTTSAGASIGMQVIKGPTPGRFDGSQAMLKLLAEKGTVTNVHSMDIRTRNLNVTPVSILSQTAYLAKTTPAPGTSSGSSGGVPGLEPGMVTTGFTLALHPNIMDSNQIALEFSVGLVDLVEIKSLTSGSGANQQSIEAPQTSGFEFKQDVFLKPYETVVLTGYERNENKYTRRGLTADTPLIAGGSFAAGHKKERLFILITPTIVGSAY